MDQFISLAKKGYEAYSESQSNVSKTGGQEYNSPDNSGRNEYQSGPNINRDEAVRTAEQHGSGDSSLFSNALGHINDNKHEHDKPINDEEVTQAHQKAYQEGGASNMSARSMGGAAAMQALQHFTSGKSSGQGGSASGGSTTELISMAMAEASKLFDKSGGAASGNKQDAVNGAAMTVMKLLIQSKMGNTTGGSNSGGLASLMSLASKFT